MGISVEIGVGNSSAWIPAHPLSRADSTHFVGSLFWLSPDTDYDILVESSDPEEVTITDIDTYGNYETGGVVVHITGDVEEATTMSLKWRLAAGQEDESAILTTRSDTFPEPTTRTRYVSASGSDSNDGSSVELAWRTIQKAINSATAGDLILIQPGTHREEGSGGEPGIQGYKAYLDGTASQPIVFRGDGTAGTIIFDGADATILAGVSWTSEGSGIYSYAPGYTVSHVSTDQGRLKNYANTTDLAALACGAPGGWCWSSPKVYVKMSDSSTPAERSMYVSAMSVGLRFDECSYLRFENLTFKNYGSRGIYMVTSDEIVIQDCDFTMNQYAGIWGKGGKNNTIQDNTISDNSTYDWNWDLVKGSVDENYGILWSSNNGRGHVIRRNTITKTWNGISFDSWDNPEGGSFANELGPLGWTTEMDIYDNVVSYHDDDGLETDGWFSNLRVFNNNLTYVTIGISLAPMIPGPAYYLYNTMLYGGTPASTDAGYPGYTFKFNNGYGQVNGPTFIYHNTCYSSADLSSALLYWPPGESSADVYRNNSWESTDWAILKYPDWTVDMDYNNLYTNPGNSGTWFSWWNDSSGKDTTWANWKSRTGQEPHGISDVADLTDPENGDFTPAVGSPLIEAGVFIAGINDGYSGSAPTIGALEQGD